MSEGRVVSMDQLGVWYPFNFVYPIKLSDQLGAGSCCPVSVRAVVSMECSAIRCFRWIYRSYSFPLGLLYPLYCAGGSDRRKPPQGDKHHAEGLRCQPQPRLRGLHPQGKLRLTERFFFRLSISPLFHYETSVPGRLMFHCTF